MASEISIFDAHDNPFATHHLIFFVTGNPGLISYYDNFFRTLHQLLSEGKSKSNAFHIYGESLAGFKCSDSPSKDTGAPYNLDQQIESRLQCLKDQRIPSGPRKSEAYDNIILIGHSVGTYIILEMLQRLRNSSSPLNIRAGILLFPTVTHLAESPSGLKFKFLFRIPGFVRGASSAANGLLWLLPRPALKWLVKVVTGMPEDATEVTTSFLKSNMGIWQALHLAKDELESITEDKWDGDIWGIEHEDAGSIIEIPKLIFYFGEEDHWVANHTRDALIAARGKGEGKPSSKPIMLIDENGVDHGFCIHHSESIAEKVKLWIEEIVSPFSE